MPIDREELEQMRDALIRARASGVRVTMYEQKRIEYASDAEMKAAISDIEARIKSASQSGRPGMVRFRNSKGF